MESTRHRLGRPALPLGTRVIDMHTVAVKLDEPEYLKLKEIAELHGIKAGPFSTQLVNDFIRSFDLEAYGGTQEALPIDKAS